MSVINTDMGGSRTQIALNLNKPIFEGKYVHIYLHEGFAIARFQKQENGQPPKFTYCLQSGKIRDEILQGFEKANARGLILNFGDVPEIDVTGLGILVGLRKKLINEKKVFRLAALSEPIERIFTLTSMMKIFEIFPTEQDAVQGSRSFERAHEKNL